MAKYLFDAMALFWLMTSLVDVLLLYFTNFTTSSPSLNNSTWFLRNIYEEWSCSTWAEEHSYKFCFDNMTWFGPNALFITWFCSLSLIWPLHRFFEQVHLIFTKYIWGVKLFSMNRGIIWPNIILMLCVDLDQWRHLWHHLLIFH